MYCYIGTEWQAGLNKRDRMILYMPELDRALVGARGIPSLGVVEGFAWV